MEKILRFLSGEAPIGFPIFFCIVLALLFVAWFIDRYSPVVNRKKFRIFMASLIGFLVFTFAVMRAANPPKPESWHVGFLPLQMSAAQAADSAGPGISWAFPEMAARAGELQSPNHIIFLRPEWLTAGFGKDSATATPLFDLESCLRWGRLVRLTYLIWGRVEESGSQMTLTITAYALADDDDTFSRSFQWPKTPAGEWTSVMEGAARDVVAEIYRRADVPFHPDASGLDIYRSPSASDYFLGRFLLNNRQHGPAMSAFQRALQKDSASLLGWYGTGLAHGESMIVEPDETKRTQHQRRMEYFLKMAAQKNPQFQPAFSSLVRYYMLSKPEPRYLDAEFAMMAANDLYGRDYQLFYNLSFMNKMRWESFRLGSREAILKKALAINPAGFDAYLELGRHYIQNSRPHDHVSQLALDHFSMAHRLRPQDLDAIVGLVTAYDYMSYYKEAMALLDETIRRYPDRSELYYSLGVVHYHQAAVHGAREKPRDQADELSKAEINFRKAVELSNHGYAHLYLGKIYDMQKKRNEAIEEFRICMKILKKDDPYREEARKKLREYFPDVE